MRRRRPWWLVLLLLAGGGVAWRQGWLPDGALPGRIAPISPSDPGFDRVPDPASLAVAPQPGPVLPGGGPATPGATVAIQRNLLTDPPRPPSGSASAAGGSRPVADILEAQVVLASHGISVGSIDGIQGSQTTEALRAFQLQQALEQTGRLDGPTRALLRLEQPAMASLRVSEEDLAGLGATPVSWWDKSQCEGLPHETLLERIAERTHAHPQFLRRLNPAVDWLRVPAGTLLAVPATRFPPPRRASLIRISLSHRTLRAFDESGTLIAHFPCSIGRIASARPVGDLHVVTTVANPNYTFDPVIFPESAEGRQLGRRLIIPPGPNNPVGSAWIGLDRPGYGIHGTPSPEMVGRTESHGCFRLANWNAEYLRQLVWVGLPVGVEP